MLLLFSFPSSLSLCSICFPFFCFIFNTSCPCTAKIYSPLFWFIFFLLLSLLFFGVQNNKKERLKVCFVFLKNQKNINKKINFWFVLFFGFFEKKWKTQTYNTMIANEKQTNITLTTKKKTINPSFYQHQLLHKSLDLWRVGLLPSAVVGMVPLCLYKDGKKMKNLEIETLGFRVVIWLLLVVLLPLYAWWISKHFYFFLEEEGISL